MMRLRERGFSAVELLITLFIASVFLLAGYQLYNFVFAASTKSTQAAEASLVAYQYLRKIQAVTTTETDCASSTTPISNTPVTGSSLRQATVSVVVSCPSNTAPTKKIRLVTSTVRYKTITETKAVSHAQYVY